MRGLNPDLVQMADEAGIDQTILDYLKARKAMSIGVLGAMARLVLCLPDNNSHIPLQTVRLPEGVSQYLQFYLREFCISQVTL